MKTKTLTLFTFNKYLIDCIPNWITKIVIQHNEINIFVSKQNLFFVLFFLKQHFNTKMQQLIDICGIDYPSKKQRFLIVYNMLSISLNFRLKVKVSLNELEIIPSVTELYKSANWLEREVWDTFGIFFSNNNDLRRILTDYGFEGYPFRKDFPQIGFLEVRYDDTKKHVLYEPVEMAQEYRFFNFSSPWLQVK